MIEFKNDFSWSFSRHRKFDTCKRQYFYHYYGSWGGWKRFADEFVQKLFLLKKMTTLPMLAGEVSHRMVSVVLEALKEGREMLMENAEAEVIQFFKKAWRESKSGEWKTGSKSITHLFEHYYDESPTDDELLKIKDVMIKSIRGFYFSDSFAFIKTLSPREWLCKEDFDSFDFNSTRVWVKLDFAVKHGKRINIYDWKTGEKISENETQLAVYALYAISKWGIDLKDLRLFDIYLKKQLPVKVKVNKALINDAEDVMNQSIGEMRELLDDEFENQASIHNFPMVENKPVCKRCFFKEICYPDNWREL